MGSSAGKEGTHFTDIEKEESGVQVPILLLSSAFNKFPIFYTKTKHEFILSGYFIPISGWALPRRFNLVLPDLCKWAVNVEKALIVTPPHLSTFSL